MNTKELDIDRKKVIKNAWRITNDRKHTCLRIRVPGGHLDTKYLPLIQMIAEKYGNGTVHLTTRQGFEIPGILWESINEISVIKNTYNFVSNYIDRTLPKEHIGYIVDRVGFETFCKEALEGITLNPDAKMASKMEWCGYKYIDDESLFG